MKFLFLLLFFPTTLSAQALPGWTLTWSDEFTQVNGTAPDSAKWGFDLGGGGWGNNELQYYTNSTNNARVQNNELVIEVREENISGYGYSSARLLTKGKFEQAYGRFEARIKVPAGQGLWPAFWTLGNDIDTVSWPHCGEIDIMEFVGRLPNEVFGTIHGPGYSAGNSFGNTHTFATPVPDDYHTYVVEWEPDEIRWYVDDIHYHTATPADVAPNAFPFDHPFFLILNVAVGGDFGGPVGGSVSFPKQMLVDYVRVYQPTTELTINPEEIENPGFESNQLSPWVGYSQGGANDLGGYLESAANTYYNGGNPGGDPVQTRSGDYVIKVFGDFSGAENYNGFHQTRPASPGSRWTANGWALSHPQDLLTGTNSAWLEVSFRDSNNDIIGLYRSDTLTPGNFTPGQWIDLPIDKQYHPTTYNLIGPVNEMIAPAGTTSVRYQAVFRQPLFDGGSVYFDDLSLVQISERIDGLLNLTGDSTQAILTFPTTPNTTYQIFTNPDLEADNWTLVETITGTGTPISRTYPLPDAYRFYRLVLLQP
ncbi:MAG: glycoside hydrolase family 16 protein [Verrucomicrobiaceae bacterium]